MKWIAQKRRKKNQQKIRNLRLRSSILTVVYANFTICSTEQKMKKRKMFYWISQDQAKIFTRNMRCTIIHRIIEHWSEWEDYSHQFMIIKQLQILTTSKCFTHSEAIATIASLSQTTVIKRLASQFFYFIQYFRYSCFVFFDIVISTTGFFICDQFLTFSTHFWYFFQINFIIKRENFDILLYFS